MPSTRVSRQPRPAVPAFRITKASTLNIQPQANKKKLDAIESAVSSKLRPEIVDNVQPVKQQSSSKKRSREDHDTESEEGTRGKASKKTRVLPTPPASPRSEGVVSESLEELRSLHVSFTRALAIDYAHHGTSNTVSLSLLMPAMTRLWKKRTVCQQDIERMLAVWDIDLTTAPGAGVQPKKSPFKLVITGIGMNRQTMLEHKTALKSATFIDSELQRSYEGAIARVVRLAENSNQLASIINGPVVHFPRLECETGTQTQALQQKVKTVKQTILAKPQATEPDFSKLNISDPAEQKPQTREEKLKSRTLGLFDRLKAKQTANASSGMQQTPAEMLRRRALHRLPELLDMLRLRQSQKLNALFRSDLHGEPTMSRTAKMKVSFSLEQLVQEITDSSRTPIASDEVREALAILGREIPDPWCSVYLGDGLKCVTLQGEGWRKEVVREWCQKELEKNKA